jgi:hypothetical protein
VVEQQIVDAEVEEADGRNEVERVVEFGYVEFQMQAEVLAEAEVHAETAVFFLFFFVETGGCDDIITND